MSSQPRAPGTSRKPLWDAPRGEKFAHPPPPSTVVTRLSHDPKDLLAINTDALEAVLGHSSQTGRQLEPLAGQDDDGSGFASRLELQLWLDTFAAESLHYRSTGIACELLLERARSACTHLRSPHLLTSAVSMTLLFHLAPQFRGASEMVTGLVDEVAQAIFVSPMRCSDLKHAAQCFGRSSYFDAFYTLVQAFHAQKAKANKFKLMQARGQRVLERAVGMCQRGHAKRLLRRWHQLAQHHKRLRQKYRKLFSRVSDNTFAEQAIHMWRQHAHRVHINYLAGHNRKGMEALHEAQAIHRRKDEELKAAQYEATRRDKSLEEARATVDVLKTRLQGTRSTAAVAHSSYTAARKQWATLVESIFNDSRRVTTGEINLVTWMKDICADQAVAPSDSATKRMSTRGRLTTGALLELLEALADGTGRKRTVTRQYTASLGVSNVVGSAMESAERVLELYRDVSRGLEPPLSVPDLVRGDQLRMRHAATQLMEMAAGGHLGLFQMNSIPSQTVTLFRSRLREEPRVGDVASEHELTSVAHDWRDGQASILRENVYANVQSLADSSIRELIHFGDSVDFTRSTQNFFDQLNFTGKIQRLHLEPTVISLYRKPEAIEALWPEHGVVTVDDLAAYLSAVANAAGVERKDALARIQYELSVASGLSFLFDVHDEDAQLVIRSFDEELRRAFVVHTDPTNRKGSEFNREAAAKLVDHVLRNVTMSHSHSELEAIYENVAAVVPDLGPAAMTTMLAAMAVFFDPNPYTPMHLRLRVFFRTLFRS